MVVMGLRDFRGTVLECGGENAVMGLCEMAREPARLDVSLRCFVVMGLRDFRGVERRSERPQGVSV